MKFPQLPTGARFRWRGDAFTKVGPLTARSEADDGIRMIPRSATISPIDGEQAPSQPASATIDPALLRAALGDCIAEMNRHYASLSEAERERLEHALTSAQQTLLSRLGLE